MKQHKSQKPKQDIKITIFVVAILLLAIATWMLFLPLLTGRLIIQDHATVKQSIGEVLALINAKGEVYNKVEDKGCSSNHSIGLKKHISCYVMGYKIFKNSGDPLADLRMVREQLVKEGYDALPYDLEAEAKLLRNENFGDALRYRKPNNRGPIISLQFYQVGKEQAGTISDLIEYRKVNVPSKDDYYYGLSGSAGYYSCETAFFEPCLFAPNDW